MLTLVTISACVNVGAGTSPETRFFLLETKSKNTPGRTQERMFDPTVIGIGPVALPRYLDRPQILTRINGQELLADEFNHWAEPLKVSIPRVMGENLASLITGSRIRVFPWKPSARIRFQVSMDIHRFEADAEGGVILKAIWRIVNARDRQLLKERESIIKQASMGAGVNHRVEGMSLALSAFSLEIAENLADLRRTLKN